MDQPPYADLLNSNTYERGRNPFYVENNTLFDDIGQAAEVQSCQAPSVSADSNLFIFAKDVLYNQNPPSPKPDPTWLDMIITEVDNAAIQETGGALLQCHFPGCQDRRVFPAKSSLQRHLDKHCRPYICQDSACHGRDFGDKGSLHRHEKEVHGMHGPKRYICPIRSCKRHDRGFPRKYNLFEHQKNCHPLDFASAPGASRISSAFDENIEQIGTNGTAKDAGSRDIAIARCVVNVNATCEEELKARLQKLHTVRAELDGDILTLEKALGIIGSEPY